jgi:aspartyl-tRNA(Asn)/glutamyl-tRNA(Gln) amidotransferase subunit A
VTRQRLLTGPFLSAGDYVDAMRRRRQLVDAVETTFESVDVLLTANAMDPACRIDDEPELTRTYPRQARASIIATCHPALALMGGLSADRLPLSFQLVGHYDDEATLLARGEAFQQRTRWHLIHALPLERPSRPVEP